MRRPASRVGPALAAALLLSACGSTVAASNGATGSLQGGQPGFNAPSGAGTTGAGALGGTAGGTGGFGTSGTAPGSGTSGISGGAGAGGTTGTTGAAGTTGGGTTGTTSGANGPGVTATTIAVGIAVCSDCDDANSTIGAASGTEDPGDQRDYYKAALNEVNDRGGVLGRKLVPVFQEISATGDAQVMMQSACETWFKDSKVLAAFMRGEIVYECARKAGAVAIALGEGGTAPMYARYPNLFSPSGIRLERLGAATVKAMVQAGWQKPTAPKWPNGKIGLITWDNIDYRYGMKNGFLAALHAAGLKEDDVRYVAVPDNVNAIGDASAAISSAVLSFQSKGIDHVFIQDGAAGIFGGGGLTLLFLQNAESQSYHPRYGFNTNNYPGSSNYPASQESGMLAITASDLEAADDAGIAPNAARDRCMAQMKKRGLRVGASNTREVAANACQLAWFLEEALKRTGGNTTLAGVVAGAESIGTAFRSPVVYGTRLARGQHDGVALFRNAMFDDGCGCMKFTSKPYEP